MNNSFHFTATTLLFRLLLSLLISSIYSFTMLDQDVQWNVSYVNPQSKQLDELQGPNRQPRKPKKDDGLIFRCIHPKCYPIEILVKFGCESK